MRFSAHGAVTMAYAAHRTTNLIADVAAKAAASGHGRLSHDGIHLPSLSASSASRLPWAMHSVRSASLIGWSSAMPAKWLAP
jgi:hypothetical protein